ncbi:hypothetical protein [Stenotrophomonas oahuensis]|uniref:Uncharacterized protein n=1 Tax=Stenotrophomonas oahuensis TaxID=3003271 RepID=A0ABY9YV04_9GAMM|nr:hypothetical protein [Stenotrophomonas sp. A5586]WNH54823.1 hypothetical protein PDM29_20990 [Stenotrophomonas sp. A5586]
MSALPSAAHFTSEEIEFAAEVALLAAQATSNGLGLPRTAQRPWVAGDESDDELANMIDSVRASHPGHPLAAQLVHDLATYRLVRDKRAPACPDLAARREKYIASFAGCGW